ncbi:MAG: hypothetical protein K8R53_01695 [Bacteroidales bacterium]|nr:hypothetical protein [Bacteroidales bacterium]
MLKYTKTILQKVSFNKDLFRKELRKSLKWLNKEEMLILKIWCVSQFGNIYGDIIKEVFESLSI